MNPLRSLVALPLVLLGPGQASDAWPRPDPEVQGELRAVMEAATPDAQRAAFDALRADAGPAHERLVPQLVLLAAEARDTRAAMLPGVVIAELRIPAEHVVAALVPLLASADPARRATVAGMLAQYEHHSLERGADFSVYHPFLAREPAAALVRHLFATDPDAALLTLIRAQLDARTERDEQRALLWAWHELADLRWKLRFGFLAPAELPGAAPAAVAELAGLARHPRWWARLAAVHAAAEEPALAPALPLDALANDVHPLVRERAAALRAEPK